MSEEGFESWVSVDDPSEREGKAVALKSITSFLTWLKEADPESDQEADAWPYQEKHTGEHLYECTCEWRGEASVCMLVSEDFGDLSPPIFPNYMKESWFFWA